MKGLIWQDDENIIDVVYQTIYGLPIKEAIHVVKLYQEKQLIPVEWIEKYIWGADTHEEKRALRKMYMRWEKENERETN